MKVAIGTHIQSGAWGGGNQFAQNLTNYLQSRGAEVFFDLNSEDLDIILIIDPRKELGNSTINENDARAYKRKYPKTQIIHRINECDERKDTLGINERIIWANRFADHTVFVSSWLRDLYKESGWIFEEGKSSIILNGSDPNLFHPNGYTLWDGQEPLKLVTHHWGNHWKKGFYIYSKIDDLLGQSKWKSNIEFTYIGRLPEGYTFKNANYLEPLSGSDLADELRSHHVYITASLCEPGSNHQNEGACCGLPLLYLIQGSMPEYCDGFGIGFENDNFLEKLEEIRSEYKNLTAKMKDYPHLSLACCEKYFELFESLIKNKSADSKEKETFDLGYYNNWIGQLNIQDNRNFETNSLEEMVFDQSEPLNFSRRFRLLIGQWIAHPRYFTLNFLRHLVSSRNLPIGNWLFNHWFFPDDALKDYYSFAYDSSIQKQLQTDVNPLEAFEGMGSSNRIEINEGNLEKYVLLNIALLFSGDETKAEPVRLLELCLSSNLSYEKELELAAFLMHAMDLYSHDYKGHLEELVNFVLKKTPEPEISDIFHASYILYLCTRNSTDYRMSEIRNYFILSMALLAKITQENPIDSLGLAEKNAIHILMNIYENIMHLKETPVFFVVPAFSNYKH